MESIKEKMNRGFDFMNNLDFKTLSSKILFIVGIIGIVTGFYGLIFHQGGWSMTFLFAGENLALACFMRDKPIKNTLN